MDWTREETQAFYGLMSDAIPEEAFPGSGVGEENYSDQSRSWGAVEVLVHLCDPAQTPNGDLILDEIRRLRAQAIAPST